MAILSFLGFRSGKRARKLYDEARELVDHGMHEEALAIARKLRKLRYSGAFEIEGLAYSRLGRNEDAVRVLREGLALGPGVWLNWMLLGSCLSNLGRYDEALLAYDRAAVCDGADSAPIHLNRAVVATRQKDYEGALRHLDRVVIYEDEGMRLRTVGVRVWALHALGRDGEAESLASRTLNEWRDRNQTDGTADIGEMADVIGEIRIARGERPEPVRAELIEWWRATRYEGLLWRIRELRGLRSPDAHYYRIILHGRYARVPGKEHDPQGYFASADVVATSAEEAFALYVELDPPEEGVELSVDECTACEARPDGVMGVYATTAGASYYVEK